MIRLWIIFALCLIQYSTSLKIHFQPANQKQVKINTNLTAIKEGCVRLYSKCDFEGESIEVCENNPDLKHLQFDKKVSSIVIGDKTAVILKKFANYKGLGIELKKNVRCFQKGLQQFKNNIASLLFIQK